MAGLVFCGCHYKKTVDETVETDRYTLHIQDAMSYCTEFSVTIPRSVSILRTAALLSTCSLVMDASP